VKILRNITAAVLCTCLIAIFLISAPSLGYLNTAHADTASPPLVAGSQMAPSAQINTPGPVPELTWTVGQPYPTFNGKSVAPPTALQLPSNGSSPPTTGGHWWVGSVYPSTSPAKTATWLWTVETPPAATPLSTAQEGCSTTPCYYVLLSAWDTAGSYDQVGFADANGVWGVTYSYTTGTCAVTYFYSYNALTLTAGQEYAFFLTTVSGPGTWAEAYTVSSTGAYTLIWSYHMPTGSGNPGLMVQNSYCGDYDYTDYQETYGSTSSSQPNPYAASYGLTFYFPTNKWGTGSAGPPWSTTKWVTFNSGNNPSFVTAKVSGSSVTVYN